MNPNVSKLKRQIGQRILQARNEAGILTNVELAAAIEREMTEYEFSISEACVIDCIRSTLDSCHVTTVADRNRLVDFPPDGLRPPASFLFTT